VPLVLLAILAVVSTLAAFLMRRRRLS
jgi:hypothetical protein